MKLSRDMKTVIIILTVFAVIVLAYIGQDIYFSYTGVVQTEYLYLTTENNNVTVEGFALRDEDREQNGSNISILKMQDGKVYIPIVSDSASVAVGDAIAASFNSKEQAELYTRIQKYEKKIEDLEQLQSLENPSLINAAALNSDIAGAINDYLAVIDNKDLTELDAAVRKVTTKITTKQLASGGNLNVASRIEKYSQKKAKLERKIASKSFVTSPYAGYFVSRVDGFESAFSYAALEDGDITTDQIRELLQMQPTVTGNAFGKIIGQHTWYYVCNLPLTDASVLKNGNYVTVNFPKENLYNIPMKVHAVTERANNEVAVVFQCTQMNDAISVLRKETAEITVQTYEGFHIRSDALVENEDGLTGVYVLSGKRVEFKPIRILYHGDGYVIATAAIYYLENGEIDKEKTPSLPQLENFDQVIVKGKNLYDGKVIS